MTKNAHGQLRTLFILLVTFATKFLSFSHAFRWKYSYTAEMGGFRSIFVMWHIHEIFNKVKIVQYLIKQNWDLNEQVKSYEGSYVI